MIIKQYQKPFVPKCANYDYVKVHEGNDRFVEWIRIYYELAKVVKQMNTRKVDETKKSNIKCEHCEAYDKDNGWCRIQEKKKNYWNRCKDFIWRHKY